MPKAPTDPLSFRLRGQFGMLTAQFLLGMAVNLIGRPDETTGLAHLATITFLILHVLIAIGLIIGAIIIVRIANFPAARQLARAGSAAIGVAVIGGLLTMGAPGANWWSFLMSVGFIAATVCYGRLWVLVASQH